MFSFPEFLDPDYYVQGSETSWMIVESMILACVLSGWTALLCYRAALKKQSVNFFWLGNFSMAYAIWNLLYLPHYSKRDIPFPSGTVTVEFSHHAHLVMGVFLPYFCHRFLAFFFQKRAFVARLTFYTLIVLALLFVMLGAAYYWSLLVAGLFIFGMFGLIIWSLFRYYQTAEDLKNKTRSFFVLVGLVVCTVFSLVGQMRAENILPHYPLPFVGNILTAVFIFFVYQMALNPRLREVRELMLRGIRVILLTGILTVIFISLLSWVGENNLELFIFNTFIASFIILSILEPLRRKMDTFFLKRFIVDRYEFEELLKKLPKKLRKFRNLDELTSELVQGICESGRVYQTALFLWEAASSEYRLVPPSNLTFRNTLDLDHPFVTWTKKFRQFLLLEQDQELPQSVRDALRDMHSHLVIPLFRGDDLLGLWALRSSLRSTNPYTSFSNDEIELIEQVSTELVSTLDQIQHFESQERQERLAALGEMSAALAHEIRNPLGAIQGAAQLLQTSPTLKNNEDVECVQILVKEISRMQKTVDQYLNFARKNEEPVSVSVRNLTEGVIRDVQSKAKKTQTLIHFEAPDMLPAMKTDPLKLEQVLFNIIQNACEAFSKNVWVKLSIATIEAVTQIRFDIKDDGPGIPAQHLSNIFTPLFTTKRAGSGLGLPICKKIIDSLGGDLKVESAAGQGTTFSIALPLEFSRIPS
jgi:two-component system sensor histidine kinase HydH